MARVEAKICGIKDRAALDAALGAGAQYVGFNFYGPSPRSVAPSAAGALSDVAASRVRRVGLFVRPSDDELDAVLGEAPMDMIQLHGGESPERTREVRDRFGLPVIKVCSIASAEDLAAAAAWVDVADMMLFDAKPPARDDALPGGNALKFDWALLAEAPPPGPWMLAGGLNPDNVAEAIRIAAPPIVDVASGVEAARGVKDPDLIRAFLQAVKDA